MRLLVLGAAGKTGREIVTQALGRGHDVVAFVRSGESLAPADHLVVVVGDAEDGASVSAAAAGCQAVVSALGHTSAMTSTALTSAADALIKALPPRTRYISMTGFNVPDPNDPPTPLTGRLVGLVIKLIPGKMYIDGADHVERLRASQLAWTVLRCPRLTMGHGLGKYELGYFGLGGNDTIARADVAAAMLDALADPTWVAKAPMIRAA